MPVFVKQGIQMRNHMVILSLLVASVAMADTPSTQPAEQYPALMKRMLLLEKENAELKAKLAKSETENRRLAGMIPKQETPAAIDAREPNPLLPNFPSDVFKNIPKTPVTATPKQLDFTDQKYANHVIDVSDCLFDGLSRDATAMGLLSKNPATWDTWLYFTVSDDVGAVNVYAIKEQFSNSLLALTPGDRVNLRILGVRDNFGSVMYFLAKVEKVSGATTKAVSP